MGNIKSIALTVLAVILGGAGLVWLLRWVGPLPLSVSQTTTNKASTFDVSGTAEIVTTPDRAEVNLGITEQGSSVKDVQDRANQVIKAITDGLAKMGVDKKDIKTANYSINPNYDFGGGKQRINGFMVNASLTVSLEDFDKVNEAIDMATAAGANQVGGISFTLSEQMTKDLKEQARKEAIADAKDNAQALANLSGMRLGKIVNVMENQGSPIRPYPMVALDMAKSSGEAGAPTQVEPGSTTFNYSVTISYETL